MNIGLMALVFESIGLGEALILIFLVLLLLGILALLLRKGGRR